MNTHPTRARISPPRRMKELLERLSLAWKIIRARDAGLVAHVREEIRLVDTSVEQHLVDIARVFCLMGHSGGSAAIFVPWISKLLGWGILAPLTGEDSEWVCVAEQDGPLYQNRRSGRVFKDDGGAYDIDGIVWIDEDGHGFTNGKSKVPVTFPYTPSTEYRDIEPR